MKEHKVLLEDKVNDDPYCSEVKTTHPRVTFCPLTEIYTVWVSQGTWCEVYGKRREELAFKLGDIAQNIQL